MDLQALAFTLCENFVSDQKGHISDDVRNLVLGWIRQRNVARLCEASDHIPLAFHTEDLCRFSRQVAAFFKKNPAFSNPDVCQKAAKLSFERAELLCRLTNKRLDHYYANQDRISPEVRRIIDRAQGIIYDTLGDIAEFYDRLPSELRITSGASATRSRRQALPHLKVSKRAIPVTRTAIPYIELANSHYGYGKLSYRETLCNRVVTVRKNWKTDRTIACEPEGNLAVQLAFDSFVKDKMRRKLHINLSDQFRNQQLAKEGSVSGNLATIDLSMASDTVSLNAVAWLLPVKWYKLLTDIRCPYGRGFGQLYKYAKLSSMGNGATFGLESLIFAALSKATGAKVWCAYGDDIIISSTQAKALIAALRFLGFRVNTDKSYTEGPFRESCGADWYLGKDVTPFYLRMTSSVKTELCHIVNGLAPLVVPGGKLAQTLKSLISDHKLPFIPWNWSSISGVWIDIPTAYSKKLIRNKNGCLEIRAFTSRNRAKIIRDSRTLFLWHLHASRRERGGSSVYQRHFLGLYSNTDPDMPPTSSIISSSVPTFSHKFVRKWVSWQPPAMVTPVHLYWWTDLIFPSDSEE